VADIAGTAMLLARQKADGLFNVTDDEPAPPQDVVTYAAKLMSVSPPPETLYEDARMSPMARSFYGEVKRVSNGKIRALGYEFLYPNYRAALDDMWQNGRWR
jgi:NAD dependent epimerase/dehydratase family enzyme